MIIYKRLENNRTIQLNKSEEKVMIRKTIEVMNTWEAIRKFIVDVDLKDEYTEDSELYRAMDLNDDYSIQAFLDNDACDIQRLTHEQCELLKLDWEDGYYIDTFNNSYVK